MDQFTRRIIGFGVHTGDVDGIALCRMFNKAISSRGVPKYLSSDNDPLFRHHQWQANLRILDIDEVKTAPYTPISHPFVERLIGTIRREFLDQTLFWNTNDLAQKLEGFRQYYSAHRVHTALDGITPSESSGKTTFHCAALNNFHWISHCRGLYHLPVAAWTVIRHTQVSQTRRSWQFFIVIALRWAFSDRECRLNSNSPSSGKNSWISHCKELWLKPSVFAVFDPVIPCV